MSPYLDRPVHDNVRVPCLYETDTRLREMYCLLMAARSESDDWRYWHVGELAFGFFMIDCHLDPRKHVRLWHDGERLIA